MKERIKELRKTLGLTLEEFGNAIGVTKMTISRLENGVNNVTEQMAKSICREFSVNEEWLRTGEGDMFIQKTKDEEIAEMLADVQIAGENDFKHRFISMLAKLDVEDWKVLERMINIMMESHGK